MVAEAKHSEAPEKDDPDTADIAEQIHKNIFDLVKSGAIAEVEAHVGEYGVEVLSSKDEWGYTPAHWVALEGNVDLMRLLIDSGAPFDLHCLGTQGPRPIHWACRKGDSEAQEKQGTFELLSISCGERPKVGVKTFCPGHTAVVQILLQSGVPVNCADFKGLTPLMTACMFGKSATAAYLLGMGAFNHLVDVNGDTAMHWAAYKGHLDLLRLLANSGADMDKPDHFGSTPLHLACLAGSVSCVKLLSAKADLDLQPRDKNDNTPLDLASRHRHHDIVHVLICAKRARVRWFPPMDFLVAFIFGVSTNSKVPVMFFLISVLAWGYPMYIIKVLPLSWNVLRASHYCFIYWNVVMWISWILCNRKNPGYLPMNSEAYSRSIKEIPYFDKLRKRNSILNRLCHTCRTLRPIRAKHCRVCNRCVSQFDHHCPFIYNCVGLRNRIWFFVFLLSVAINCSYTFYFASYCIYIEGHGFLSVIALLEGLVFATGAWMLACAALLHASMNLTSNEMMHYKRYPYLRDKRGRYVNPFSRGPILNLIEFFFCTPEDLDEESFYEYL